MRNAVVMGMTTNFINIAPIEPVSVHDRRTFAKIVRMARAQRTVRVYGRLFPHGHSLRLTTGEWFYLPLCPMFTAPTLNLHPRQAVR